MMAADAVRSFFEATEKEDATWPFPIDPNLTLPENRLSSAIKLANKQIYERSLRDHALQGMGTTVVGLLISAEKRAVHVAHVGDSRAYRIRDGKIAQLTRDHSLYAMLQAAGIGELPPPEEFAHRSVVTRAVGTARCDPDTQILPLVSGDTLLLCSDGLTDILSNETISQIMLSSEADVAARALVSEAYMAGGDDNITAVVVRVEDIPVLVPTDRHTRPIPR